jgi:Domain of unknown function (DUF4129)
MRTRALIAVGALVVLAGVVARGGSAVPLGETRPLFGWIRLPDFFRFRPGDERPRTQPERPGGTWLAVIDWAVLLLPLIALLVVIALALIMSLRARKPGKPTPVKLRPPAPGIDGERTGALLQAVRAAERVLAEHQGGPPGDAVIAAWLELERVAADTTHTRQAHETPTEFTDALVAEHADIQRATAQLRALYHRARFGRPGSVGKHDAEAARRALADIRTSLVAP